MTHAVPLRGLLEVGLRHSLRPCILSMMHNNIMIDDISLITRGYSCDYGVIVSGRNGRDRKLSGAKGIDRIDD